MKTETVLQVCTYCRSVFDKETAKLRERLHDIETTLTHAQARNTELVLENRELKRSQVRSAEQRLKMLLRFATPRDR